MKKFLVALLPIALSAAAAFGLENGHSTVSWKKSLASLPRPVSTTPLEQSMAGRVHGRYTAVALA